MNSLHFFFLPDVLSKLGFLFFFFGLLFFKKKLFWILEFELFFFLLGNLHWASPERKEKENKNKNKKHEEIM